MTSFGAIRRAWSSTGTRRGTAAKPLWCRGTALRPRSAGAGAPAGCWTRRRWARVRDESRDMLESLETRNRSNNRGHHCPGDLTARAASSPLMLPVFRGSAARQHPYRSARRSGLTCGAPSPPCGPLHVALAAVLTSRAAAARSQTPGTRCAGTGATLGQTTWCCELRDITALPPSIPVSTVILFWVRAARSGGGAA